LNWKIRGDKAFFVLYFVAWHLKINKSNDSAIERLALQNAFVFILYIALMLSLGGNQNSRIFDFIMQSMPMPSVNRQRKFASLLNIHCNFFLFLVFFFCWRWEFCKRFLMYVTKSDFECTHTCRNRHTLAWNRYIQGEKNSILILYTDFWHIKLKKF